MSLLLIREWFLHSFISLVFINSVTCVILHKSRCVLVCVSLGVLVSLFWFCFCPDEDVIVAPLWGGHLWYSSTTQKILWKLQFFLTWSGWLLFSFPFQASQGILLCLRLLLAICRALSSLCLLSMLFAAPSGKCWSLVLKPYMDIMPNCPGPPSNPQCDMRWNPSTNKLTLSVISCLICKFCQMCQFLCRFYFHLLKMLCAFISRFYLIPWICRCVTLQPVSSKRVSFNETASCAKATHTQDKLRNHPIRELR